MSTKDYNVSTSANPVFNNVLGLTNKTFDITNVRSGYMATEDQIQQLWQDIIRLEERIDYCCRDIVYWDFRVEIRDKYGNLISEQLENRTTGITRRGKNFIMKLPIKAIPKYENHPINTACVSDSSGANLCEYLWRGTTGEYYEMSDRKASSFAVIFPNYKDINANGVLTTATAYPKTNSYHAYTDDENNLYIEVREVIGSTSIRSYPSGEPTVPFGRLFVLELRDVTL